VIKQQKTEQFEKLREQLHKTSDFQLLQEHQT